MNTEFKDIDKRYDLFWLGMKYEKENNVQQAIETYLLYSEALAFADRYIPHIWISGLYDKLILPSKAIYHIEQHVKGYIEWKASIGNKDLSNSKIGELYRDIGKRYLGNIAQYLNFVDEAYVHKALRDEAYKKILFDFNGHILEERAKSRYKLISKI